MECRLPEDKLMDLQAAVVPAWGVGKLTLRQLQLLLGEAPLCVSDHADGQGFLIAGWRRPPQGAWAPGHRIRLTWEHRADLLVGSPFWTLIVEGRRGCPKLCPVFNWSYSLTPQDRHAMGPTLGSSGVRPLEWREAEFTRNLALWEPFLVVLVVEL